MAAQDLVTLTQVRTFLELSAADTGQNAKISTLITAASDGIMRECEREFAPVTASATRRFRINPAEFLRGYYVVDLSPPVSDLQSATLVRLHPEATTPQTLVANSDYLLEPNGGGTDGVYTYLRLYPTVPISSSNVFIKFGFANLDITGTWGFASVPTDVQDLCMKVIRAWLRPDVGVLADVNQDPHAIPPQNAFDLPMFAKRGLFRYKRRPNIF